MNKLNFFSNSLMFFFLGSIFGTRIKNPNSPTEEDLNTIGKIAFAHFKESYEYYDKLRKIWIAQEKKGIKKKVCTTLKKDNMVFPKEKCTIIGFFMGKTNNGLIFITGIFCSSRRIIKSPKT